MDERDLSNCRDDLEKMMRSHVAPLEQEPPKKRQFNESSANPLDITVIILTRNEEKLIKRCIESVPFAKEIIVLDSGSIDATREIASGMGARVFLYDWTGDFSKQRNIADTHAGSEWVLHLDADEIIPIGLASEMAAFLSGEVEKQFNAVQMPRKELIFGKWIEHGGWYPQHKVRLYRRDSGSWVGKVHERLVVHGDVYTLSEPILHDSYKDIHTFIEKFNRYSTIDAEMAFTEGRRFSVLKLFFQPLERFFGRFIVHRGYRDGFHGFVIAALIGLNYFMRYLKLWEIGFRVKNNVDYCKMLDQ